jgi:hypothetical protein
MKVQPHYYLMKNKKILRLEGAQHFEKLSWMIRSQVLEEARKQSMDQEQANWRVAIFRDEILTLSEYIDYLHSPECVSDAETA